MYMSKVIITSTYKDQSKLLWVNNLNDKRVPFIIYQKRDGLVKEIIVNENVIEIPNIGRCDYAFLYHIVKNYDNLHDTNVFVKCNWRDNGIPFSKIFENCDKYDFMTVGTHEETINWDINDKEDELSETKQDWLREIFPENCTNLGNIQTWGHGPCFSVSRRMIHRHPVEVYEKLMNKFLPESGSFDTDYTKYPKYSNLGELIIDVGKRYHNEFLRFYPILFTHDLPESTDFKIFREKIYNTQQNAKRAGQRIARRRDTLMSMRF